MRVLVVGGTALVGPHFVRSLHERGHEVAEKCDFDFEGIFRLGRGRPNGELEDRFNFATVRD